MCVVSVVVKINKNSFSLKFSGHADYDPGNDIVCAGISTLFYTLLGALLNVKDKYDKQITIFFSENQGLINCVFIKSKMLAKYQISIILDTVYLGMKQIELKYPDNVRIIYDKA